MFGYKKERFFLSGISAFLEVLERIHPKLKSGKDPK